MLKITQLKQLQILFITLLFSCTINAQVGIGTDTPTSQLTVTEDATFNESGGNHDFRIESDGNTNMFNIDAQNNVFGFNGIPNNVTFDGFFSNQILEVLEIGNDGASGNQIVIGSYLGAQPVISPESDFTGISGNWDGVNNNAWSEVNSYAYFVISSRHMKRDIYSISDDKSIENYVMEDIDKIKPSFYKYNMDLDNFDKGHENKYRPQMRLGVITDEAPDYVTDATNSKVSLYALTTLGIAGIKYNKSKIEKIEEVISTSKLSDFGSVLLNGNEIKVNFENTFTNKLSMTPIVTVTSDDPNIIVSVKNKTKNSFVIFTSKTVANLKIDWIAMGKSNHKKLSDKSLINNIDNNLKSQLEIPESIKQKIKDHQKTNGLSRNNSNN